MGVKFSFLEVNKPFLGFVYSGCIYSFTKFEFQANGDVP